MRLVTVSSFLVLTGGCNEGVWSLILRQLGRVGTGGRLPQAFSTVDMAGEANLTFCQDLSVNMFTVCYCATCVAELSVICLFSAGTIRLLQVSVPLNSDLASKHTIYSSVSWYSRHTTELYLWGFVILPVLAGDQSVCFQINEDIIGDGGRHCSQMGPHWGTWVPMGTFFSLWVPIRSPLDTIWSPCSIIGLGKVVTNLWIRSP